MVNGTTPTHIFSKIPYLSNQIKQIWITYMQNGSEVLTKDINDVTFTDDTESTQCTATITLTQEDTLLFKAGQANIQLRILLTDDTALATSEVIIPVKRLLHGGEIS